MLGLYNMITTPWMYLWWSLLTHMPGKGYPQVRVATGTSGLRRNVPCLLNAINFLCLLLVTTHYQSEPGH